MISLLYSLIYVVEGTLPWIVDNPGTFDEYFKIVKKLK